MQMWFQNVTDRVREGREGQRRKLREELELDFLGSGFNNCFVI